MQICKLFMKKVNIFILLDRKRHKTTGSNYQPVVVSIYLPFNIGKLTVAYVLRNYLRENLISGGYYCLASNFFSSSLLGSTV